MDKCLYLIKIGNLYGFIDKKGEIKIKPIYKDAYDFNDGVAMVTTVEGKSYVIDRNNDIVLKLDSNKYIEFENGLAQVKKNNEYGFIDKGGNWVIKPQFNMVLRGFNKEGFAIVNENDRYGTINKQGEFIVEPKFTGIGKYSEGVMSATNSAKKAGLIDNHGNIIIDFKFDVISSFSEGLAYFEEYGKYGFINTKEEIVIKPKYHAVWGFYNGLSGYTLGADSPYGFINKRGEVAIENKYQNVGNFNEGLAVFTNNDLDGYINIQGKEVIKNVFATADDFENGLALVTTLDNEWGYINTECEWVYRPKNFNLW
ncbi:WG repeat-containing protein [Clostridium estertheticum]|uniref:WG repeat-containing protein n=1 Tax=Clostridium estertheticum TaxID=238834 RepID=A0A5N7J8B2_9CLOT|nr:WG repeat-containing protein [Clostridium estertheticum]MBU3185942.1 WG repeat-containing protein [Clostridium estertheticum]MPQ31922.1 WG repeat-containing protein [Clostridium estertheticum]MPQ64979.1 WG repeat-containing protein [Clostridium estertheticum]